MADYVLSANITADADKFNAAVRSAMSELKTLQDKTSAISDKITGSGKTISMVGAGMTAAITMPFVKAVQTTADFEQAMTKAGTIAGASAEELKAMTDAAIELGASTSLSGSEVAVAMSEMAAKGFDANQVIAADAWCYQCCGSIRRRFSISCRYGDKCIEWFWIGSRSVRKNR